MVKIESFKGMPAVVTGAGDGMAREVAIQLANMGCSLALCDIDMEALTTTKALAIDQLGKKEQQQIHILTQKVDVRSVSQVDTFFNAVMAEFGQDRINLLINAAGINRVGFFKDMPADQFDATFDVGFRGLINMTRRFLPVIVANKNKIGFIANMSSVYGLSAALVPSRQVIPAQARLAVPTNLGISALCAENAAIKNFTEALYLESKAQFPEIGVGAIIPGHVAANLYNTGMPIAGVSAEALTTMKSQLIAIDKFSQEEVSQLNDADTLDAYNSMYRDHPAALPAKDAAKQIIDGIKAGKSRIFVGDDSVVYDIITRVFGELALNEYFATFVTYTWATTAKYAGKRYPGFGVAVFPVVLMVILITPIIILSVVLAVLAYMYAM